MRHIIFSFLYLICTQLSAQNIVVDYNNFYNSNVPMVRESKLVINASENRAIYHEDFNTTKLVNQDKIAKSGSSFATVKRNLDKFYTTDQNCERVLYDDFALKKYIISDNLPIANWEITNESKLISNYKTVKATCTFRGRTWIAWFAPEIPFSFGPWKLCGLPGIILEAYDQNKQWTYSVRSINLNSAENIVLPHGPDFKSVTIKEFVALKDEFNTNFLNEVTKFDRDAEVEIDRNLRAGIEPKFEWEKN